MPAHKHQRFENAPLDRQIEEIIHYLNKPEFPALSEYAGNTAALAGGMKAGQVYKTATGVLMVVY